MPPARSATAAPRRQPRPAPGTTPSSRPRPARRPRAAHRSPRLRVRWERVGRVGLLLVLGVVVGLYAQHALSYLRTRGQSDRQQAVVRSLQRQNAQLLRQQRSLNSPATIMQDARALGMVRPGEQPYALLGASSGH